MLAQQHAELLGCDRVRLAVLALEHQPTLRPLQRIRTGPACRYLAVAAVTVKVEDVVVVRALAQVLSQAVERGRPQHPHLGRKPVLLNQLHQRT